MLRRVVWHSRWWSAEKPGGEPGDKWSVAKHHQISACRQRCLECGIAPNLHPVADAGVGVHFIAGRLGSFASGVQLDHFSGLNVEDGPTGVLGELAGGADAHDCWVVTGIIMQESGPASPCCVTVWRVA